MPKIKVRDISVTWPSEDGSILLDVIEEKDEPPVDITDLAIEIGDMFWGKAKEFTEDNPGVGFADVIYPNGIRIFYKGKRVKLQDFHDAFEYGLIEALQAALRHLEDQEASHSQA